MDKKAKKKLLEATIAKYEKKTKRKVNIGFGNVTSITYVPSPFITFNEMMGGGFPRGQFGVFAGPEKTGKSTKLLQTIAYNQKLDPDFTALWTDTEDQLDENWCRTLGVDLERMVIQKAPEEYELQSMEEILEEALALIKSQAIDFWVVDSIGGLTPSAEIKKELAEGKMLDLQRKFGEFFRKAINIISPKENEGQKNSKFLGCPVVFIGQVYNVPTSTGVPFYEVRGGNAVKHWAFWRIMTRRGSKDNYLGDISNYNIPGIEKAKKLQSGWAQHLKLEKSKMNDKESKEIVLQFDYGTGLNIEHCTISAILAHDIIPRGGAWYNHELLPDGKIQGKENLFALLTKDEELREKFITILNNKIYNIEDDNNSNTESITSNS